MGELGIGVSGLEVEDFSVKCALKMKGKHDDGDALYPRIFVRLAVLSETKCARGMAGTSAISNRRSLWGRAVG